MSETYKTYKENVRKDVYKVIDGEREYQSKIWNESTTSSGGRHETAAFLTYMRVYLERAEKLSSTLSNGAVAPAGHEFAGECDLDFVRKVTALGVACMEQNGAPKRLSDLEKLQKFAGSDHFTEEDLLA